MAIVPEDKDWTWVLGAPCDECGFDAQAFSVDTVDRLIRANAASWVPVLARPDVATRPSDDRWSPLEYACHVRDVFSLYHFRLGLMLEHDDPLFPNWDQDEAAIEQRYHEQEPPFVASALVSNAEAAAHLFATVTGDQWNRPGRRSDNKYFTIETFARYFIHDPIHHLWDVGG